jgi:hypothetical protein
MAPNRSPASYVRLFWLPCRVQRSRPETRRSELASDRGGALVRPFSFAVQAAPAKHPRDWLALARRAEERGYRAVLVPDHQGSGGPIAGMAAAGAATTSLRVGSLEG